MLDEQYQQKNKTMLTREQKEKIKIELLKKLPSLICPMCQGRGFTMADGYFLNSMQEDLTSIDLGEKAIPTIGVICKSCGFVSQHALGALGLLPEETQIKANEPK